MGAVAKRGHAQAIFHAFGSFWGWFSLLDLVLTDWLIMITEFIGMTAARCSEWLLIGMWWSYDIAMCNKILAWK
jgi:Mn2+/Fe2+ NRAMP family transporter